MAVLSLSRPWALLPGDSRWSSLPASVPPSATGISWLELAWLCKQGLLWDAKCKTLYTHQRSLSFRASLVDKKANQLTELWNRFLEIRKSVENLLFGLKQFYFKFKEYKQDDHRHHSSSSSLWSWNYANFRHPSLDLTRPFILTMHRLAGTWRTGEVWNSFLESNNGNFQFCNTLLWILKC